MAIHIKSDSEIQLMREAGKLLAQVHEELKTMVVPGMTTLEIDQRGEALIRSMGCIPSFKNYGGYPASVCISVNDEVVHGIPKKHRILQEGDIVSLDCGLIHKGFHSDAARTYGVGVISQQAQDLIDITRESFFVGIAQAKEGNHLHDISNAIGDYCESRGYGVVRDLVGHGIGRNLHEDPQIPNFRVKTRGPKLRAGMALAIEPMICIGRSDVVFLDDDWTVVTRDGSLAAHYENTIVVRDGQPEILTLL